jgi:glutathione S-transferase
MLKFYYSGAPNPTKVALFFEEAGIPYEAIPIDTRKGEQHKPEFVAINPNAKLPAIVDGDVTVFDSNAILLYLAEKTGKFLPPKGDKARGELLSWLMFVATGVGPYSGQSVHFRNFAPDKISRSMSINESRSGPSDRFGTAPQSVQEPMRSCSMQRLPPVPDVLLRRVARRPNRLTHDEARPTAGGPHCAGRSSRRRQPFAKP